MESIQRSLMLLKPGNSNMIEQGKSAATLKLNASTNGLVLSLATDCLKKGEYSVYLFMQNGNERYVGVLKDGHLHATLYDTNLDNISGAAVIHSDNGSHSFCLKSTGMDWAEIIERFRIQRNTNPQKRPQFEPTFSITKPEDITLKDVERLSLQERQLKESVFLNNDIAPNSNSRDDIAPNTDSINDIALNSNSRDDIAPNTDSINDIAPNSNSRDDIAPNTDSANINVSNINSIKDIALNTIKNTENSPAQNSSDYTENICDTCPHVIKQDKINPFPAVYPNSEWVKISYPGPTGWWHYISGKIFKDSALSAKVLGVPGEYGLAPPIWLEGFGTYMRCVTADAKGYWLMFQDAETGAVLDPGLSPHDG